MYALSMMKITEVSELVSTRADALRVGDDVVLDGSVWTVESDVYCAATGMVSWLFGRGMRHQTVTFYRGHEMERVGATTGIII